MFAPGMCDRIRAFDFSLKDRKLTNDDRPRTALPRGDQGIIRCRVHPGSRQLLMTFSQVGEVEACQTIKMTVLGGVMLYLCKSKLVLAMTSVLQLANTKRGGTG